MKEKRKLAAIMFTDIVGYTTLMSKDEYMTLGILETNRHIHKATIRKFHGESIKEIGDGTLAIFDSSWDAVLCAIEIQTAISGKVSYLLRIGIHIGDIVISGHDVFGDGVNIASRIQSLCAPGNICISQRVFEDIRNKAGIKAECLGEKLLKNIDQPVNIYALSNECFQQILDHQDTGQEEKSVSAKSRLNFSRLTLIQKLYLGISSAILVIIILVAGYFLALKRPVTDASLSVREESMNRRIRSDWKNSIAVLPFTDLSPDKDQEYFCDGISEELINVLAHIPELKVAARTSAFSFRGKGADIREIGEKLDVKTILEGSVRKSGSQIRISAQLIDVKSGYHLWSENYDLELKDMFEIQDEIATAIVSALKQNLLPEEKRIIEKKNTENAEAYQLYLKGRYYWNKRKEADLEKALDYFEQAIGIDSNFALAYAGLASTYALLPDYAGVLPKVAQPQALRFAEIALGLDSTLSEPHAVIGMVKCEFEYDFKSSEEEFLLAIELNPNFPTAHHWYAILLRTLGRFDEAVEESEKALDLDPLSMILNTNLGWVLYFARQYDLAKEQFRKTIELDPNFYLPYYGIGTIYLNEGRYDEAREYFRKESMLQGGDSSISAIEGYIAARTGHKNEVMKIIDQYTKYSAEGQLVSVLIAKLYWLTGDKEKTFYWLDKAYEDREVGIMGLKIDPIWDSLRDDPRFIVLLKKMGYDN